MAEIAGLPSPADVDPDTAFAEMGFDSLAAVELARTLSRETVLELSPSVGFDYPTPAALARWLVGELTGSGGPVGSAESAVGSAESAVAAGTSGSKPPSHDDPIAIVGMSCRLPGGVRSPRELWELVAAGAECISEFPRDRGWDLDALYDPDADQPHTTYVRCGGFLKGAGEFDASFFGIGEREALAMDPQHRLLLEVAWEALERGGIDPGSLRGSPTGVFVGLATHDYYASLWRARPSELEGYVGTGTAGSVASGRIAYTFALEGPAITVDTACASSLVSIHLASQALRAGECELALAGGVAVMASPHMFVEFSRQRALSPQARCRSYSTAADGTAWSEGVGLVVLERLSDARRHGHEVLALVRGSAVNQDGASNGLSAPNGPSQERVIRAALASGGLGSADVDAVEGHGTATPLGDPIELGALLAVYGSARPEGRPLWLGSLKSNIGHAQAAAGVAGVIKMVEALRREVLPPTLHADPPLAELERPDAVALLSEARPWRRGARLRRAGVSAFGLSGTNAHVVLEEAPAPSGPPTEAPAPAPRSQPTAPATTPPLTGALAWSLSAKSPDALRGQAERLERHLASSPSIGPTDVAYTLAARRARLNHRAVAVGADYDELIAAVGALARGEDAENLFVGTAHAGSLAFVFPGQGSQWPGMALELLGSSAVFREAIEACDGALAPHTGWSLLDMLRGAPAPSLERLDVVQPALFSMMVSLAALWRSCGVEPDVVVGHSQGEIAAAHVCGALSLDDAALVVALRSQALRRLAGHGGMVSITLAPDALKTRLEPYGDRISLAAMNGPCTQVVAGDPDALEQLLAECDRDGVWARRINVDYASHTPQIELIREELLELLATVAPVSNTIPFFSTVNGELTDGGSLDAEYWYRNLRRTVQFEPVIRSLLAEGCRSFVEVSAHPVLTVGIEEIVDAAAQESVAIVETLRREDGGPQRFAGSLATLHASGRDADLSLLAAGGKPVELPTYAFERRRYWFEGRVGPEGLHDAGIDPVEHPLLAATVELADGSGWLFTGRLSLGAAPWLADHRVLGAVVVSGTALVELALTAGRRLGCPELRGADDRGAANRAGGWWGLAPAATRRARRVGTARRQRPLTSRCGRRRAPARRPGIRPARHGDAGAGGAAGHGHRRPALVAAARRTRGRRRALRAAGGRGVRIRARLPRAACTMALGRGVVRGGLAARRRPGGRRLPDAPGAARRRVPRDGRGAAGRRPRPAAGRVDAVLLERGSPQRATRARDARVRAMDRACICAADRRGRARRAGHLDRVGGGPPCVR